MSDYYASIKKAEKRRSNFVSLSILYPILGGLAGQLLTADLFGAICGFVIGCLAAYLSVRFINHRMPVPCPACGGQLQENYPNCSHYSPIRALSTPARPADATLLTMY